MQRIHIVGVSPRTGTTLLTECMIACFEIDAFEKHEAPLCAHRRNAAVYLTKTPGDIHIVAPRLRIDRRLHVIAMMRDPRDIVVSVHGKDPNVYWTPLWFWKNGIGIVRRLRQHKRFVLIRYEDLVREPDAVQESIMVRLPFLKKRTAFSAFHTVATPSRKSLKALGQLRAIGPESIGNWRNHLPRVKGQISTHGSISEDLIEFGYEPNDAWLSMLESIEPDLSSSHWPEHIPLPAWKFRRLKYAEAARIAVLRLFAVDEA